MPNPAPLPHLLRAAAFCGALLALASPAAAADTLVVDPTDANGSCVRGTDNTCKTIAQAAAAVEPGDTITLRAGTYAEAFAIGKDNVRLQGVGPAQVKIIGSGTGDVVTLSGRDTSLSGVTIEVPSNGGSAIAVTGSGAQITDVAAHRAIPTTSNESVVDVAEPGSASIAKSFIVQNVGDSASAIGSTSTGGVSVADSLVLSSTGHAVWLAASQANKIVRSTVLSTFGRGDALRITSNGAGDRAAILESTVLLGGRDGAGIRAETRGSSAGDVRLDARHVTVQVPHDDSAGLVLDASEASQTGPLPLPAAVGNIEARISGSIIRGRALVRRHEPSVEGVTSASNRAKATYVHSDAQPPTGSGTWEMNSSGYTQDAAKIFQPSSFRIRGDAPVIDRGGPLAEGESVTDFEGGAREVDGRDADTVAQSDMGADEWANVAPKAVFAATDAKPRATRAVGFVSGSTDEGDPKGVAEHRWDFGDGSKETTKVSGVAHTYAKPGTYTVTLVVADADGLVSEPARQTVTVIDGTPPRPSIVTPAPDARLRLNRLPRRGSTRKLSPRPMKILGRVTDESGVQAVEVSLRLVERDPRKKARRKRARRSTTTCEFYSGRVLLKRACDKPVWLKATLRASDWRYTTRRGQRLPAGLWEVRVRAGDNSGLISDAPSTQERTLVRFRTR